ncbi:MAG: hypothetical protein A2511_09980 [Deltaproteobacteria bacterium RIFOXYD12_FULL_50_9]|nr:MAG: hypothetical protein A2511_09980 [Deltaproteobacteria bacterium RIFOXYD12_FULL_50_9]
MKTEKIKHPLVSDWIILLGMGFFALPGTKILFSALVSYTETGFPNFGEWGGERWLIVILFLSFLTLFWFHFVTRFVGRYLRWESKFCNEGAWYFSRQHMPPNSSGWQTDLDSRAKLPNDHSSLDPLCKSSFDDL